MEMLTSNKCIELLLMISVWLSWSCSLSLFDLPVEIIERIADNIEPLELRSPDRLSPDDKIEVFRDYKKFLNNYKIDEISVGKVEEIANIYSSARKLRMIKSDVQPIIDQIQTIIDKRDHLKMYPPEPRKLKGMSDFEFRRLATEYKAQREYVLHTLLKLYDTQNKLKRLPTDYAKLDLIPSYRRKGDVMTTIKNRYMAKSFNELTPKDQADLRNEYKNFIERESKPLDKHDYEGNVERARNVYNSALTLRLKADDIKPYLEEMTKRIEYNSWHLKKMDKDLADPSVSDNYKNGVKKERPIVAQETIDLNKNLLIRNSRNAMFEGKNFGLKRELPIDELAQNHVILTGNIDTEFRYTPFENVNKQVRQNETVRFLLGLKPGDNIKGRLLSEDSKMYKVGIGGIIATLERANIDWNKMPKSMDDVDAHDLRDFYIMSCERRISREGINVKLTMFPPFISKNEK
ncbi:hypothetical protein O9G_000871 [Rozella allomycis CSF55]|uniref:F-box domain-containing protein n=2 Tax=Rozella allomycis (strain CSF55) TaxID=988480 RepID=A0A075AR77_ROZAC|nr:hypothetical protein O9G_000871 [Rozella allomycis CSF55]|eukprot:EPZ32796.1 hypothetical protein O9G_000871 [Rozella allomycis CSF55]